MMRTTSLALLALTAGLALGACGGRNATNDGRITTVGGPGSGNADGTLSGGTAALGRGGFAGGAAAAAGSGPLASPYGLNTGRPAWR